MIRGPTNRLTKKNSTLESISKIIIGAHGTAPGKNIEAGGLANTTLL